MARPDNARVRHLSEPDVRGAQIHVLSIHYFISDYKNEVGVMTLVLVLAYPGAEKYYCVECCARGAAIVGVYRPVIMASEPDAKKHVSDIHKNNSPEGDEIMLKAVDDMQSVRRTVREHQSTILGV